MKRRVFISQPMKGLSNNKILEEREKYKQDVINMFPGDEIEFIDSMVNIDTSDTSEVRTVPVAYLGKSISLMATADLVYFADGWENTNGCAIEHDICMRYGIPMHCIIDR
jgi:hypothetical protein